MARLQTSLRSSLKPIRFRKCVIESVRMSKASASVKRKRYNGSTIVETASPSLIEGYCSQYGEYISAAQINIELTVEPRTAWVLP